MKKKMIFIPFFFVGMAALVIWVVMLLWNWLTPDLFGWRVIDYWEAAGILLLSKILFGGFGGGKSKCHCQSRKNHAGWKRRFKHKWTNMSEDEKKRWEEKFKGTSFCGVEMELEDSELNQKEKQQE